MSHHFVVVIDVESSADEATLNKQAEEAFIRTHQGSTDVDPPPPTAEPSDPEPHTNYISPNDTVDLRQAAANTPALIALHLSSNATLDLRAHQWLHSGRIMTSGEYQKIDGHEDRPEHMRSDVEL